ncbi:MAG: ABC transporter ATP-binding protein [Ruminococcaceae bacterium]|nr:ABC transporter ATP-binding protein [Oscillospiraceae bacterium]
MKKKLKIPFTILRLIVAEEPTYLLWSIPQTVTGSVLPLLGVYTGKRILQSLTEGDEFRKSAYIILICAGLMLLLMLLDKYLANRSGLAAERFAAKLRFSVGQTAMQLEMQDMEGAEQRKVIEMANNAAKLTGLLDIARQIVSLLITIAGLALVAVTLTPMFMLMIAAVLGVKILFTCLQYRFNRQARELMGKSNRTGDYLNGLAYYQKGAQKEIRVNALQDWFMGKILHYREEMVHLQYRDFRRNSLFGGIMAVLMAAQSAVVLLMLTDSYLAGEITVAEFAMYFHTVTALSSALMALTQQIRRYSEQVLNFTDYQKLAELRARTKSEETTENLPADTELIFENVSFTYPGSDKPVLEHLNLTVRRGEKLMIVGPNGSGKTTLIKLLCRLYRPTAGRITLGGADIWQIPADAYFRVVAAVFQDYQNFAFSLAENISMSESGEDNRIQGILGALGLTEFIRNLPRGTDTPLTRQFSADGVELSGGQDQKIAIARTLYRDTPVMVLDEPTASLDPLAESEIYGDFARMTEGKTAIFISHRLAAATLAQRILVLEGGRVTECGSHGELMRKNGTYAEMYRAQSRAYLEKT